MSANLKDATKELNKESVQIQQSMYTTQYLLHSQ